MRNKVKSIVKKVPEETTLSNGLYIGTWGGFIIELKFNNYIYELATEDAVTGVNIPVVVEVIDDNVTFDTTRT